MKWHLNVDINLKPGFRKLCHQDPVLSLGSCFSEHMGNKLDQYKWNVSSNPFGILYNPISVGNALQRILGQNLYTAEELTEVDGQYVSMDHHGSFSASNPETVLTRINEAISNAGTKLAGRATIMVTFGTAWYYILQKTNRPVGNCHKLPSAAFERRRINTVEIVALYKSIIDKIKEQNPEIQWIFTVSPVRHWKDGASENQWSKSILTCAVREIESEYDHVHYFPSYEIVMDELRDHRFYNEDLIHPSQQAIDYIWDRFTGHCLTDDAILIHKELSSLGHRMEHRAIHPESEEHLQFIQETERQLGLLKNKYPHIKF